jgi:hypothetical protein
MAVEGTQPLHALALVHRLIYADHHDGRLVRAKGGVEVKHVSWDLAVLYRQEKQGGAAAGEHRRVFHQPYGDV